MTTLRIGAIEVAVVSDGHLSMEVAAMFGPAQPTAWRELVALDERGRVPFAVNCVLVRVRERRILIDTGTGRDEPSLIERYGRSCGRLVDNLADMGVSTGDVDTVIVSHAHGDHIGGATRAADGGHGPTYPNARYWLSADEWAYWSTPEAIAQRPFLGRTLLPLERSGRLERPDADVEVAPGVRLVAAPGHTPGHVCVALTSGREMAVYTGDLIHHSAQLDHPEWSPAFDLLPELSADSRRRILDRARREGALLLTAHLPTPGIARPTASGARQ